MKLTKHIPVLGAFLLLFAAGCGEDVNPHLYEGPSVVHFASQSAASFGTTYFVNEANDPGFIIPVGVTAATNQDRTIQVEVIAEETTAVQGEHYTMPATVTIPAGQTVGNLVVQGTFANLAEPKRLAVRLASGQDNGVFNQTYSLTMRQFCPYEQSNFVGVYRLSSTVFGGEWDVEVQAGATEGELIVIGMYEDGYDVKIMLDDSNPSNFVATVAAQDAYTNATYGAVNVKTTSAAPGRFSACENTISLVLQRCVSVGCFAANDTVVLRKL